MGYLQLPAGITDFSKAVISFWFRVPSAVLIALDDLSDTPPDGFQSDNMSSVCYFPPLFKTIPLLVFGSIEHNSDGVACQPSFVGVDCAFGLNKLVVNLQTTTEASFSADPSGLNARRPACFNMGGASLGPTISGDSWHHVLISFDISSSCSLLQGGAGIYTVTSGNTFTWSVDDVERTDLTIYPAGGGPSSTNKMSDPNNIAAQLVDYNGGLEGDTVSFGPCHIHTSGQPIGIPSSAAFSDNVQLVEMAELQVFTGVSANAGAELVRRLFVTGTGVPASRALPQAEFGQAPDICLKGSNWILGTNTGTGGNFAPTGTITAHAAPSL